ELYKSLGFEPYAVHTEFIIKPDSVAISPSTPHSYQFNELGRQAIWQTRYDFDKTFKSDTVQHFEPVERSAYYRPRSLHLLGKLMAKLMRVEQKFYAMQNGAPAPVGIVGYMANKKPQGVHYIMMKIDAAHIKATQLALTQMIEHIHAVNASPTLRIELEACEDD